MKILQQGLTKAQLDARKQAGHTSLWELIAALYNDPSFVFCPVTTKAARLLVNQFHQRDASWCQNKWSEIRGKYSKIKAQMDVSGEGNDKEFAAYLHQKDWHPKVMKVVHRLAVADPAFMDWAYHGADLGGASNAPNAPSPPAAAAAASATPATTAGGGKQGAS